MTALDPSPVLTSRRGALDQLDDLRERVAVFIDRPTAEGLRLLTLGAKDFLRYEVEEVLPQVLTAGPALILSAPGLKSWQDAQWALK